MSDRGGGRRSRSRKANKKGKNNNSSSKKQQEKEMKFAIMSTGSNMRYHPFDTVKKHIVSKLKENPAMMDVATALQNMEELDKTNLRPTRKLSSINPWVGTGDARKAR